MQELQFQSAACHPAEGWKYLLTFWFPRDPSRPSVGGCPGGPRHCCEDRWMYGWSQHGLREHCLPGSWAYRWGSRKCQLPHRCFGGCSVNTAKRPLRAKTAATEHGVWTQILSQNTEIGTWLLLSNIVWNCSGNKAERFMVCFLKQTPCMCW